MSEQIPFSSLVKVNPPLDCTLPNPRAEVSFISMQDVTNSGDWTHRQSRQLLSIGSGYTPFQESDVLFAKITPCMENGKGAHAAGLVNGLGFGSTEFHVLRAIKDISPRFVFHICNSREFRQAAEIQMIGSAGQKRVPAEFFARFFVPRFSSAEQHAIATIFDTMDEAIRRTEAVLSKLRQVKAGMLHDLLTRGLGENGELRDPIRHPEQFKDSSLGRIPKGWEIEFFGNHILLLSGQHIEAKRYSENSKHVPYLTGPADFPEGKIIVTKYTAFPKVVCRSGDILITVKGSGTGKTIITDASYCISRQLMAVRAKNCSPRFLYYLLTSFSESLRADASGLIPGISRMDLLDKKNSFPPIPEQQNIADKLDSFDQGEEKEKQQLDKLLKFKQGLLHDLLTGHVRVPSHLLEAMS